MRTLRYAVVALGLVLTLATSGVAGPLEDAAAAYQRGDYATALNTWRLLAVDQGNASAQYNLGFMYHNGQGVPKDYVQSYMWLSLAAAQGDADAARYRDAVANLMPPRQIAEAQKIASDWIAARSVP